MEMINIKKIKILIYSNFNTPNYMNSPYLEESSKKILFEEWIDSRMDIFFNYTLKSLKAQTNQNFTAVYNYTDPSEELVLKAIEKRGGLPENVLFVPRSEYEYVVDELIEGYDRLYLTKLDSDDMYINTFVDTLLNLDIKDDTEAIICSHGYLHDTVTGKLKKMWHMSSSFHTYIYKLDEEAVKYYTLDLTPLDFLDESHFSPLKHKYEYFDEYCYVWNIHSNNSSSKFNMPNTTVFKALELVENESDIKDIMDKFM